MTLALLNGKYYGGPDDPPLSEARLSAFDAGLQHAVGLFETMLGGFQARGVEGPTSHGEIQEAWALHLDRHMERLAASAHALGLSDRLRTGALAEAVLETVKRARLPLARVRLTITGGDLSLLAAARSSAGAGGGAQRALDPGVLIVAQPATEYPAAMFENGVRLTLAETRANPLSAFEGHKTLNYWWRLRELQVAAAKGAGEALVLSITNHVCGGCVSNLLCIKDGHAYTPLARGEAGEPDEPEDSDPNDLPRPARAAKAPVLHSPVLPGVTRAWAIEQCQRWGMGVSRRMLSVQDVPEADELLLTNSSWGVLPVVQIEMNSIARAVPGPTTLDLRQAWLDLRPRDDDE